MFIARLAPVTTNIKLGSRVPTFPHIVSNDRRARGHDGQHADGRFIWGIGPEDCPPTSKYSATGKLTETEMSVLRTGYGALVGEARIV